MKELTESQLETIIGGAALPAFFDQFRNANGKIVIGRGTMQGDTFVPMPGTTTGTINRIGDSTEGLSRFLQLQQSHGNTHVALGESGKIFAIKDVLAKIA